MNKDLLSELITISQRTDTPEGDEFFAILERLNGLFESEDSNIRPNDAIGRSGGIIYLDSRPVIVIPDIHARMNFILQVLGYSWNGTNTVFESLSTDSIQVLCLGDYVHSESRGYKRWKLAMKEYLGSFRNHSSMDDEIRESFGLTEMVLLLKEQFPASFHMLKGNHENILNEEGDGNHPFGKFVYEGQMMTDYVSLFYGDRFLDEFARYEKNLPVVAVGKTFMASHAEPKIPYSYEEVLNYRDNPDVVSGLTWTPNDGANPGSVEGMITTFMPGRDGTEKYLGGHRPVMEGNFSYRAGQKYVQINNPDRFLVAKIIQTRPFSPDHDIVELNDPDIINLLRRW